MSDYGEIKPKKKIGCLGAFLIFLLIMALIAGAFYLFLPKIISSAISGWTVSTLLPKGIQKDTQNFTELISDNIDQLEEFGLSTDEAIKIISSIDLDTLEDCLDDIQQSSIKNSSELLDTVEKHIDLSAADLNKIKSDYYTEFQEGELNQLIADLKESPVMKKSSFRIIKETLIEVLNSDLPNK